VAATNIAATLGYHDVGREDESKAYVCGISPTAKPLNKYMVMLPGIGNDSGPGHLLQSVSRRVSQTRCAMTGGGGGPTGFGLVFGARYPKLFYVLHPATFATLLGYSYSYLDVKPTLAISIAVRSCPPPPLSPPGPPSSLPKRTQEA
jgi:hypothetical protein